MRLLALAFLLPAAALAQTPVTGALAGTITDDTDETLPGATVFLPEIQRGAATGMDGTYAIAGIPVGTYEVQFSSVGYGSQTIDDVVVSRDRTRRLDATLLEGSMSESIQMWRWKVPMLRRAVYQSQHLFGADREHRPDRYRDEPVPTLMSTYRR